MKDVVWTVVDSDGQIIKLFKNESKANEYCGCHECCKIELREFNDEENYTCFCVVKVKLEAEGLGNSYLGSLKLGPNIRIEFSKVCFEDYAEYHIEKNSVRIYDCPAGKYAEENAKLDIYMRRVVPLKYDGLKIKKNIKKFLNDLFAEAVYMLHEGGWDDEECMKEAREGTEAHVRERLNEFKL